MRKLIALLILLIVSFAGPVVAAEIVEIPASASVVDLGGAGTALAAQGRNAVAEVPGETFGSQIELELRANGPGPEFNWTLFTIRSTAATPRKLVLAVDEQRFPGSRLVKLLPFGRLATGVAFSSGQNTLEKVPTTSSDAVAFVLKPGVVVTLAIEGASNIRSARIYTPEAFSAREASLSFLGGAVLAVAVLLGFAMIALYGMRAHGAFFGGGFFALTAFGFMALEGGYMADIALRLEAQGISAQTLRAVVESLFFLGFAICIASFNGLRQRGLLANLAMLLIYSLCIANILFAFFDPRQAAATARLGFGLLAVLAFVIGLAMRKSRYGVVYQGMLLWSSLVLWTFFAAVAAVSAKLDLVFHTALLAGLAAVLAVMAFTLVRFAFFQGFLAQPFLTDASRRSLALAGAQHYLWDWQPYEGRLEIGPDLPRSLGYDHSSWQADADQSFTAVLHADDEPAYRALTDLKDVESGQFHEQDLRLKEAGGAYRWFSLRARVLPGPNQHPARCIGTLTDITRNRTTENRLLTDAVHDSITGLPSRAIFLDRLAREIAKPMGLPVNVLLIGLQRFKKLDQGLGHDLGDQLLLVAGQRISECMVGEETAARTSGSQFTVMFVEAIDHRDVMSLANDIMAALSAPVTLGSRDVYLSASIGVSLSSSKGFTAEELQKQAAGALHEAQRQGLKSIVVYEFTIKDERAAKVTLEAELRRAVERLEIEVHYQPIVSLETRDIAGFEALARWRHPQQGLLPPAKFIDMAEQAGMIAEISDIVLNEAIRQMGIWQRVLTRGRPIYVAVNMSANQLTDMSFADRLRVIINREGLRPNAIKIELTESVVMRHPDRARLLIDKLNALGVGVACDDFGTGFSSLASLRDLPFDTLKIDRSFLMPEALEGRGGAILDMVVALAHNLDMIVVAEGIESDEQADRLLALGCDLGQGFHLGQPVTARDVQAMLAVLPRATLQQVYVPEFTQPAARPLAPSAAPVDVARVIPQEAPPSMPDEDIFETDEVLQVVPQPEELPSIFSVNNEPKTEISEPPQNRKMTRRERRKKRAAKSKPEVGR